MKYLSYIVLFKISIFTISCSKTTITPIPDPDPCYGCEIQDTLFKNIDTIWSTELFGESSIANDGIFVDGEKIVFSGSFSLSSFVSVYNKSTGIKLWERMNDIEHYPSANLINGNLVLQNRTRITHFNTNSEFPINDFQQTNDKASNPYGELIGNYYYYSRRASNDTKSWLVRTKITDFKNWETIYTLERGEDTGGSRPQIQSYNLWVHPETGDSIILLQHRMAFPDRVDIVAWNHSKKENLWRHDHISPIKNSSNKQIMILKDRAYFSASSVFYCFDMRSGDIIWKFDHPSGINSMLYYSPVYAENENAIILKDDADRLISFDADTGEINWNFTNRGASSVGAGSPVYHNGVVYYCMAGRLYAVVAATGKVLLRESSSIEIYNFRGELAVDRENDILYAMDGRRIYAIKTLEPN